MLDTKLRVPRVQAKVRVNPQNANRKGLKDLKETTSDSLRSWRSSWFDFQAKPFGSRFLTGLSWLPLLIAPASVVLVRTFS